LRRTGRQKERAAAAIGSNTYNLERRCEKKRIAADYIGLFHAFVIMFIFMFYILGMFYFSVH